MMEKVASKAKSTVAKAKSTVKIIAKVPQTVGRTVLGVPQTVGRTILSVPDKIFKKSKEKQKTEPQYEFAERLAFISQEIIENQQGRQMVRESQLECMKEITNHLKPFLVQHPSATYEQWVAELHPDNAEYSDGRIDHRFYVEDSDHRLLWNEFMKELAFIDRIVEPKSIDPSYHRKR
jgi:transcriptional regulator